MGKLKYVMSEGLAFSEEKDMRKLQRSSLKGWHVRDFKFMGYTLEKGAPAEYIYSVDYRTLEEDETEEYLEYFSSAGWTRIASEGNIHLFRASPGTQPIYSDRETVVEKHDNSGSSMKWGVIALVVMTALVWLGTFMSSGTLQTTLAVLAIIFSMITLPLAWTLITIYNNKWKAEGRKGLVNLTRPSYFIILIMAAVIMFSVLGGVVNGFRLLIYMVIGAVALPATIWCIMSLYHKWIVKST